VLALFHLLLTLDPRLVEHHREEELERSLNEYGHDLLVQLRNLCYLGCQALKLDINDEVRFAYDFLCDRRVWNSAAGRACWKRSGADEALNFVLQRGRRMQETSQTLLLRTT